MSLPTSGAIKMSDVKADLHTTDFSLRAYSAAFNLTTPDSMSEFYGLSGSGTITITPLNSLVDTSYTFYSDGVATTFKSGSQSFPINTNLKLEFSSPACSVTKNGVAYTSGTIFTIALGATVTFQLKNADHWVNTTYYCDTTTSSTECYEMVTQTNDCGTTRNIAYPTGTACNRTANYSGTKIGVKCYGCTDVDIFQNQNKCYTGTNKYYSGYNGGTYYTTNPVDGGCDRTAYYTNNIGSYCYIIGYSCSKVTVQQNSNVCFLGNQFKDSRGVTYASNPSTHGYNDTPCSTAPTLVDSGYTTCYNCSNTAFQIDNNPCSSTHDKYYFFGSLYNGTGDMPPITLCDTVAHYDIDLGLRCYNNANWNVYKNSNTCNTTDPQYKLTDNGAAHTVYLTTTQFNAQVSSDCCWVADPACVAGTCNYMGARERNTCTNAYRNTQTTSTTNCSCGQTCGGTTWHYYCNLTDYYRESVYVCNQSFYTGTTELLQECDGVHCTVDTSPIYTNQSYTTCYNCYCRQVYKNTNKCSGSTYGHYFVDVNGIKIDVGTQPTGGCGTVGTSCNTTSNCVDTGSAYCSGGNWVINQTQANGCSTASCGVRTIYTQYSGCQFSSTKTRSASGSFTRNNCAGNCDPGTVTYTQSATETRTSFVSQADADNLANDAAYATALSLVNSGGQAYANANAGCCCWVGAADCQPSTCNYRGDRQRNECTGAYRNEYTTAANSCNCGVGCQGTYYAYSCDLTTRYKTLTYYCNNSAAAAREWVADCSADCGGNTSPLYENQNYTTCYNCGIRNVYKDVRGSCSATNGQYYVYTNDYVLVGGAPTQASSCNTNSQCVDTGTAHCSGANYVISQTQTNPCSGASCPDRVIEYNSTNYGCYTPPACTSYRMENYNGYGQTDTIEWTDCSNHFHSQYLSDGSYLDICVKNGTGVNYFYSQQSTLGTC